MKMNRSKSIPEQLASDYFDEHDRQAKGTTGLVVGTVDMLASVVREARYRKLQTTVVIVQPGMSKSAVSEDMRALPGRHRPLPDRHLRHEASSNRQRLSPDHDAVDGIAPTSQCASWSMSVVGSGALGGFGIATGLRRVALDGAGQQRPPHRRLGAVADRMISPRVGLASCIPTRASRRYQHPPPSIHGGSSSPGGSSSNSSHPSASSCECAITRAVRCSCTSEAATTITCHSITSCGGRFTGSPPPTRGVLNEYAPFRILFVEVNHRQNHAVFALRVRSAQEPPADALFLERLDVLVALAFLLLTLERRRSGSLLLRHPPLLRRVPPRHGRHVDGHAHAGIQPGTTRRSRRRRRRRRRSTRQTRSSCAAIVADSSRLGGVEEPAEHHQRHLGGPGRVFDRDRPRSSCRWSRFVSPTGSRPQATC